MTSIESDAYCLHRGTDNKSSDENLAKAKILTMLQDLGGKPMCGSITRNRSQNIARIRDAAHRWFFSQRSDFEIWCDAAGYDVGYMRENARQVYGNGLPETRARPGKGMDYEYRKRLRGQQSKKDGSA